MSRASTRVAAVDFTPEALTQFRRHEEYSTEEAALLDYRCGRNVTRDEAAHLIGRRVPCWYGDVYYRAGANGVWVARWRPGRRPVAAAYLALGEACTTEDKLAAIGL